jgi:hypothetical protein
VVWQDMVQLVSHRHTQSLEEAKIVRLREEKGGLWITLECNIQKYIHKQFFYDNYNFYTIFEKSSSRPLGFLSGSLCTYTRLGIRKIKDHDDQYAFYLDFTCNLQSGNA